MKDGKETLSKADLKAKRREQQEAQRRAKTENDKAVANEVMTYLSKFYKHSCKSHCICRSKKN